MTLMIAFELFVITRVGFTRIPDASRYHLLSLIFTYTSFSR